jgi:hypothetical protein
VSRFGKDSTVFVSIREFYDKNRDGKNHAGKVRGRRILRETRGP